MKIHNVKAEERKGDQQAWMVFDCRDYWCWLNNHDYQSYPDIMNMKTSRYNYEHDCFVTLTYHLNPKKW